MASLDLPFVCLLFPRDAHVRGLRNARDGQSDPFVFFRNFVFMVDGELRVRWLSLSVVRPFVCFACA